MGLGFTVAAGRWWLAIPFVALFLGIYLPVMRVESGTLAQLFGKSFQEYSQAVPMFLPRMTAYRADRKAAEFDRSLYLRYREYRAALGLLAGWGLLFFKVYFIQ